jgi:hypothetical protein
MPCLLITNSSKYRKENERRRMTEVFALCIWWEEQREMGLGLGERNRNLGCLCCKGKEGKGFRSDRISGNKLCMLPHPFFSINRYRVFRHLPWVEVKVEYVDTDVKTLRWSVGVKCGLSGICRALATLANEGPVFKVLCSSATLTAASSSMYKSIMCTYPSAETHKMYALIDAVEGKGLLMNNPNTTRRRAPADSLKFTENMDHRRSIYHSYR